jgi:hypothetical protein
MRLLQRLLSPPFRQLIRKVKNWDVMLPKFTLIMILKNKSGTANKKEARKGAALKNEVIQSEIIVDKARLETPWLRYHRS